MDVQQGRSERGGEAYSFRYVEPLSDARTKLADIFNILLRFFRRGGAEFQRMDTTVLQRHIQRLIDHPVPIQ